MERLREQYNLVEDNLAVLRQLAHFCINEYDYHHRNNELQVLKDLLHILKLAGADFKSFLQRIHDFEAQLELAHRRCDKVDQQFVSLGLVEKSAFTSSFEEELEEDANKENEVQEGDSE